MRDLEELDVLVPRAERALLRFDDVNAEEPVAQAEQTTEHLRSIRAGGAEIAPKARPRSRQGAPRSRQGAPRSRRDRPWQRTFGSAK